MLDKIVLDAKSFVSEMLMDFNEKGYLFHNLQHTLEIFERVNYLGQKEGLNDDLMEMLQLGALFHDTGFSRRFHDNESTGAEIFEGWIKENYPDYPKDRIDIIKNIILATIVSTQPQNILEEIIKDADMDNIGRDDFFEKGEALRSEYKNRGGIDYSDEERMIRNFNLFKTHRFYTKTSIAERKEGFKKNFGILSTAVKKINKDL